LSSSLIVNLNYSLLRGLPRPLIAKFSSLCLGLIDAAGHRAIIIYALHRPVVRIVPHELSFTTAAAARVIYVGVCATVEAPSAAHTSDCAKPDTALPRAAAAALDRTET
jgi:hypothetical protein